MADSDENLKVKPLKSKFDTNLFCSKQSFLLTENGRNSSRNLNAESFFE